ncbi:MAG: hypothetical protein GXY60_08825 [Spirochaetales bacterium]|nr:hypothetical protein [Spirochaetales bacterium]
MKKVLIMFILIVFILSVFAGCSVKNTTTQPADNNENNIQLPANKSNLANAPMKLSNNQLLLFGTSARMYVGMAEVAYEASGSSFTGMSGTVDMIDNNVNVTWDDFDFTANVDPSNTEDAGDIILDGSHSVSLIGADFTYDLNITLTVDDLPITIELYYVTHNFGQDGLATDEVATYKVNGVELKELWKQN